MKQTGMAAFMKRIDLFGTPIPGFNIQGKTSVNTKTGAMVSFIVIFLTLAYSLLKMQHMIVRKNPSITVRNGKLDHETTLNLGSDEFMMAFALEDFKAKPIKLDDRYVRW